MSELVYIGAVFAIVSAILSINSKTETERVLFKVIAVLCIILLLFRRLL